MKRKISLILCVALTVCMLMTCITISVSALDAITPEGSGTQADPYKMENAGNLKWLSDQCATANMTGKFVVVTNDIDFGGIAWTPIGNATTNFRGTFDGQNHVISNFTVSGVDNAGLFGRLVNATVKNIRFSRANVTSNNNSNGFAGILSGYAQGSTISNIYTDKNCKVVGVSAGGIIGRTWSTKSSVSYCVNNAMVTTHTLSGSWGGGIIGIATVVDISNCINNGNISAGEGATSSMNIMIGGIVGRFGGTAVTSMSNCVNTGLVSSSHTVGGIIGINSFNGQSVTNCITTTIPTVGNGDYSGSLVGRTDNTITLTDCYYNTNATYGVQGALSTKATLTNCIEATDADKIATMNTAIGTIAKAIYATQANIELTYKQDSTAASGTTYDVRFVATLNTLDAKNVTFNISGSYNGGTIPTKQIVCTTVYTGVYETIGSTANRIDAPMEQYFAIIVIKNIPSDKQVDFTIQPVITLNNDTVVNGVIETVSVNK